MLRRQLKRNFRKPLVVFTPKSLLRHPSCYSTIEEFTNGKFQEIIDDSIDTLSVKKLVICSGKLYYEILQERKENKRTDVAIVRLEQLYPIPEQQLQKIIKKYNPEHRSWAQEEPENMGAWSYILRSLRHLPLK